MVNFDFVEIQAPYEIDGAADAVALGGGSGAEPPSMDSEWVRAGGSLRDAGEEAGKGVEAFLELADGEGALGIDFETVALADQAHRAIDFVDDGADRLGAAERRIGNAESE